jgi:uncharacterized protein with HEPN domain
MRPEVAKLLKDILDHAREIASDTAGLDEAGFRASRTIRKSVLWDFLVIGEAMTRLRKLDESVAERITNWQRVIAFRNQLIHGYDVIRDAITWKVVTVHLPLLLAEAEALLADAAQ